MLQKRRTIILTQEETIIALNTNKAVEVKLSKRL